MSPILFRASTAIGLAFSLCTLASLVDCRDPYLSGQIACINAAPSRTAADACRAKLQDAAPVDAGAPNG